jgi:hypothetical protein
MIQTPTAVSPAVQGMQTQAIIHPLAQQASEHSIVSIFSANAQDVDRNTLSSKRNIERDQNEEDSTSKTIKNEDHGA